MFNLLNLFECFIFPIFNIGSFIPSQISSWDNTLSFLNKKNYFQWDYGDHYTITSTKYSDCGSYHSAELKHFINEIGTDYIVAMYGFYCLFAYTAFIFGSLGSMTRYCFFERQFELKQKFRLCKGIANFFAFCCSVPSFYAFKVHYGDCIKVNGNLEWLMNKDNQNFGNVGFWLFIFSPCVFCLTDFKGFPCLLKIIASVYILLFFAEAIAINFMFNVDLQVP